MIAKVKKNPTDPVAILVGGIIEILAILEIPEKLGLNAQQVAQLGGALIMIAGALRFILTKHKEETPAAQAPSENSPDESSDSEESSDEDESDNENNEEQNDEEEKETPVESAPAIAPPPKIGGH